MSKILAFLMPAVMIFYYLLGFGLIKTDGDYTVVRTDKLNSVLSLYATAMTARISTAPAR
ncbi:MAG: hypothetical protein UCK97_04320 [Acutalibacteraceae bacterium]|nr:hypothetical protein [Acutalibacteraceae bacterium]